MIPWLAICALVWLLIYAWEREDKAKAAAERAGRRDTLPLPSGAQVEVWVWPVWVEAQRENARWQ